MAQEDKSVRKLVQEIEARTGKLDKAIDKLSDSLVRIGDSLAKPPEEGPGREDLIKKFKQPFASPEAVKSESNSEELLDQIKDAIVFNQKDNFALFKSIDQSLKKIEEKGVSFGGGMDVNLGRRGPKGAAPDTKKAADTPDKKVKPGSPQAAAANKVTDKAGQKAAGGTLSKVGGALAKGARFIPGVGLAVAGGMAAMDAYSGATEAEKVLDIKDREATPGERLSAGAGGLVEGLTFGLMSRERAAKGIESARQGVMNFFSGGGDKEPVSTAGAVASASMGQVQPDFKYIEEQRKKKEAAKQQITTSTTPVITKPVPESKPEPLITPATSTTETTSEFSKEYLEKVISGEHPRPLIGKDKAQELLNSGSYKKPTVTPTTPVTGGVKKPPQFSKEYLEKVISGEQARPLITKERAEELLKKQKEAATPASQITPTTSSIEPSRSVNQMSQENADMREGGQAVQPVVINNSSSVATNTQTFTPLRASARPNNNSFERKQNMAAAY